jgi:hypothetical protein
LIGAGADDEEIRKRGDAGEIQDLDIGSFLGFCGADGDEPGRNGGLEAGRFFDVGLGQKLLLTIFYYVASTRQARVPAPHQPDL